VLSDFYTCKAGEASYDWRDSAMLYIAADAVTLVADSAAECDEIACS
jgi:hypothetical protein